MLKLRVITALVLAPLALAIVLLAPTWVVGAIFAALFLAGAWEWSRLIGMAQLPTRLLLLAGYALLMGLWAWLQHRAWPGPITLAPITMTPIIITGMGSAFWLGVLAWLASPQRLARVTRLSVAVKALAGAFMLVPAWVGVVTLHETHAGWLVTLLLVIWAGDTGAYFVGKAFGKRKLAPSISPGKTWMGAIGGLCSGAVVALAAGLAMQRPLAQVAALALLGVLTAAGAIVGDLFESIIKRHAMAKDSGRMFPGHGGVLDRLDASFAAASVFTFGVLLLRWL